MSLDVKITQRQWEFLNRHYFGTLIYLHDPLVQCFGRMQGMPFVVNWKPQGENNNNNNNNNDNSIIFVCIAWVIFSYLMCLYFSLFFV